MQVRLSIGWTTKRESWNLVLKGGTVNRRWMAVDSYMCPTCGAEVKVGKNCPGCTKPKKRKKRVQAKSPRRSWEQDDTYDGLGLPDEDFDYDEFVAREFGNKPHRQTGIKWYWWITALVLVIGMLTLLLAGAWW